MRVLVLGSGAREHAIIWAFSRSKSISGLYAAPGNAGTGPLATNCPDVDPMKFDQITSLCRREKIDLVFVGPEAPLAAGIVDRLRGEKILAVGPSAGAAQLEASKVFSKRFMQANEIPTAVAEEYSDWNRFKADIGKIDSKVVIKKSGLAAGKGVLETDDPKAALDFGRKILQSDSLLVEEFLDGYEISIFALTDGEDYLMLPVCTDFKKSGEGDTGLNTGGMGAVCPVPGVDREMMSRIERDIVAPTFEGMRQEGIGYAGILYFGLMITGRGPQVLEYNVRLGDPECQVLLPVIDSDFGNIMNALIDRTIGSFPLTLRAVSAVGVVVASGGYPGAYRRAVPVTSLPAAGDERLLLFHASTRTDASGRVLTGGGRCFTVVGIDGDILAASRHAYSGAEKIRFAGSWYRRDIGKKFYLE